MYRDICTGKIQVNYANVIPLLQLADKYNVRDLLKVNTSLSPVLWSQSWPAPDKINFVNTNLNNKYSLEKSSKIILLFLICFFFQFVLKVLKFDKNFKNYVGIGT